MVSFKFQQSNESKQLAMASRVHQAEELGALAFEQGYTRIFHIHKEAVQLTEDLQFGDPESLSIMKAWYQGWDKRNISNPLPR